MKAFSWFAKPLVAIVTLATLTLAGASVPAGAATAKITKGGNFTFVSPEPVSFNPATAGTLSQLGPALYNVYDALAIENNKTGEVEPKLLKSLTASPDAKVWTFKLRPNVKFTDGTPLDAAAIKYNFDYNADPANRSAALAFASTVQSWDVSDPLVAVATLKTSDGSFPHSLVLRLAMVASPTALQKYGADYGTTVDKVAGAGPFTLKEWTRGSQLVFQRNPSYWNAPKPYLDTVTARFITDSNTAYNSLATGAVDAMTAQTQDILDQAKAAGIKNEPYYYNVVSFRADFMFNLARPPFNDLLARQAVYAALDPKKIAAAANAPVADSIYDHDNFYYDKVGTLPKFDAKKAQDLINQWSAKNGGKPLEFTILAIPGVASLVANGEAIQAALTGYQNLKVNVENVAATAVTPRGLAGNFDLFPNSLGGSDPDIPLRASMLTNGGRNYGKYSNPQMDAALNAGIATAEPKERRKVYVEVQRIMMQDLPQWVLPVKTFTANMMLIGNKNVQDYKAGAWAGVLTDQIWLKAKK